MRVLTWNVNGLATTLQYHPWSEKKSYKFLLDTLNSDIACFQEVKCQRSKLSREMALVPGYNAYFSFSKAKLGYSGVAVYVKDSSIQPKRVYEGVTGILDAENDFIYDFGTPAKALDDEGRCIILDFGFFVLFNIYFPNDSNEARIDFKMDYHYCVRKRIESFLDKGKQVLLVGDINAVHEEIDHCDAKQSMKDHDITDFKDLPHRRWLDNIIDPKGPLIDMTRLYHPDRPKMYTCWNTRLNARPANFGTRIDYILASKGLKAWFRYSDIQPNIHGSDHCPVYADFLPIKQDIDDQEDRPACASPLLTSNFPEFRQNKLSNYFAKSSSSSKHLSSTLTTTSLSTPSLKRKISNISSNEKQPKRLKSTQQQQQQKAAPNTAFLNYFIKKPTTNSTVDTDKISNITTTKQQSPQLQEQQQEQQQQDIDLNALIEEAQEKQVTAKAWTSIFKAPEIPNCAFHKLPCLERIVTKKGPNFGRAFYICSKPNGPKDAPKEEFSCDFFQWKQQNTRGKG